MAEKLYNNIILPHSWPPSAGDPSDRTPRSAPYLVEPPEIIDISLGRQLLVDDFLIETTTMKREFHLAEKYLGNPVLKPETELEKQRNMPFAAPKSGGVWWDTADNCYKMWYEAGWLGNMALAVSSDGLVWKRPNLPIHRGTNSILNEYRPDSTSVVRDPHCDDPGQRYKLLLRGPNVGVSYGLAMVSADGINWGSPKVTGPMGDRSTMFYNPFRRKWVFSIKSHDRRLPCIHGRARYYREHSQFLDGVEWSDNDLVFWVGADELDHEDPDIGDPPQLYNLDAVGYESLMLGMFQIHKGPDNRVCQLNGRPKVTELTLGYSRDGFHWHRPDRRSFIQCSRSDDAWDNGYVQSVCGLCTVSNDMLYFYYSGVQGDSRLKGENWMLNGMYANGSTGIATLRRDGFASMNAHDSGRLTTRLLRATGKYLFVNADCAGGEMKVEVVDDNGNVFVGYSHQDCNALSVDSTRAMISWKSRIQLPERENRPFRLRFYVQKGKIFSFWVSNFESGLSGGPLGAGSSKSC